MPTIDDAGRLRATESVDLTVVDCDPLGDGIVTAQDTERALRQSNQQLQLLSLMGEADASTTTLEELYDHVLNRIATVLRVDSLAVVRSHGADSEPSADDSHGLHQTSTTTGGRAEQPVAVITATASLRVADRSLGTLAATTNEDRAPWNSDDDFLLRIAADRLALSIERTEQRFRLATSERFAAELIRRRLAHAETLEKVTARLSLAYTPIEVAMALHDVAKFCRADHYVFSVHDRGTATMTTLVAFPLAPELMVAPIDAPVPAGEVVLTGRPMFFELGSDLDAAYPVLAATRRLVGDQSMAIVPLTGLTNVLGAVMFGFVSPQAFDDRQQAELVEIGRRCGQAYERAQLLTDAEEAARRATLESGRAERALTHSSYLLRLTDELRFDEPITLAGPKISRSIADAVGADGLALYRVMADGESLLIVGQIGLPDDIMAAWRALPIEGALPVKLAIRNRFPTIWRNREEIASAMPEFLDVTDALGAQAILAMALWDDADQHLGLAFAIFSESLSDDVDELQNFYALVGREASQALARSRRADDQVVERRRAEQLTMLWDRLSTTVTSVDVNRIAADALVAAIGSGEVVYHWATSEPWQLHRPIVEVNRPEPFEGITLAESDPLAVLVKAASQSPAAIEEMSGGQLGNVRTLIVPLWTDMRYVGSMILNPPAGTVVDPQLVCALGLGLVQTFARTRLFEAERDARLSADDAQRANAALRDAAGALAGAPTFADITWAVIHHAAALFGASSALLAVATPHRPLLQVFARGDGPDDLTRALVHVDAALPGPHAARTQEPLYFESAAERLAAFPRSSSTTHERGAAVFLPQESQNPGYVSIFLDEDRLISLTERDLAVTFARLVFQAVDRAALVEAEKETARSFQQRLLDAPPFVHPDVTIATRYLAGANEVHIGGDWHDALTLRDGRVLLVVGDVVGRGLVAATAMAQLRNAVRAFAQIDPEPSAILTRLDTFISDTSATTFATAAIALLDPADGSLRYTLAGHLPPLIVGERETTWLGDGLSPPLGLCARPSARASADGHLADGDQLLLYTDGLIERRNEPLQTSLDRLMRVARSLRSAHPERVATTTLDHAGVTPDDTALVVARIRRSVHAPLQVLLPSRPTELRNVRAQFADWLNGTMLTTEAKDGLILSVSEAIANSIEHAHRFDPSLTIDVRAATTTSGDVEITISDQGIWQDPTYASTESRGRGLPLIRALTSQAEVLRRGNGSTMIVRYIQPDPLRR